jgi:hypothetical protein
MDVVFWEYQCYNYITKYSSIKANFIHRPGQKLLGIISVDFDIISQLLLGYSVFSDNGEKAEVQMYSASATRDVKKAYNQLVSK